MIRIEEGNTSGFESGELNEFGVTRDIYKGEYVINISFYPEHADDRDARGIMTVTIDKAGIEQLNALFSLIPETVE